METGTSDTSQDRENSLRQVITALNTPQVVNFLTQYVPYFYASVASKNASAAQQLVIDAFTVLTRAAKTSSPVRAFEKAAETVYKEIFRAELPSFWFTPIHQEYKVYGKPQKVVPVLADHLKGKRILDIGCGSGNISVELQKRGYSLALADVLDYRAAVAKSMLFKRMTSPTDIPYDDDQFDSAFFFEVLHHVYGKHHRTLLKSAHRVAKRLVVIEGPYGPMKHPLLRVDSRHEDLLPTKDYLAMSLDHQLKTLILMDYYVNIASKGIFDMDIPFQFKTMKEWLLLFDSAGFKTVAMTRLGFFRNTLNRNFQVYFVLERKLTP